MIEYITLFTFIAFTLWAVWTLVKINLVFDKWLSLAIDFAYDGDYCRDKIAWVRGLSSGAYWVLFNPFCLPSRAIKGKYAAEFFRWHEHRKQARKLISEVRKDLLHCIQLAQQRGNRTYAAALVSLYKKLFP